MVQYHESIDMYLNRYDIFIQNFKAKAIWWAIMDREGIGEDLKFNYKLHESYRSQKNVRLTANVYMMIYKIICKKRTKGTCEDEPKVLEPRHITSRPLSAFRVFLSW